MILSIRCMSALCDCWPTTAVLGVSSSVVHICSVTALQRVLQSAFYIVISSSVQVQLHHQPSSTPAPSPSVNTRYQLINVFVFDHFKPNSSIINHHFP